MTSATDAARESLSPDQDPGVPPHKVDLYEKLLYRAEDPSSAPNECGVARASITELERKWPGIRVAYIRTAALREAKDAKEKAQRAWNARRNAADPNHLAEGRAPESPVELLVRRAAEWGLEYVATAAEMEATAAMKRLKNGEPLMQTSTLEDDLDRPLDDDDISEVDFSKGSLVGHLEGYVELECETFECDEDATGDEHEFKVTIPVRLMDRVCKTGKNSRIFTRWLVEED